MVDFTKQYFNAGIRFPLYFWCDKNGRLEINCLIITTNNYLIYAGEQRQQRSIGTVIPWQESAKLIAEIRKL